MCGELLYTFEFQSYIIDHKLNRIIILQINSDMYIQYSTCTYYIAFKIILFILFCVYIRIIMNNSLNHAIKLLTDINIL